MSRDFRIWAEKALLFDRFRQTDISMCCILHRAFPRDFSREMRAQSETCLHREYNLAMKNKSSATQCSTGVLLRMLRHGG